MSTRNKANSIPAKDWDEVDSPPLSATRLKGMQPLRDLYPDLAEFAAKRNRGQRGPQKALTNKAITIRVDRDVLDSYKATGPGWQSRMNEALKRGAKSL